MKNNLSLNELRDMIGTITPELDNLYSDTLKMSQRVERHLMGAIRMATYYPFAQPAIKDKEYGWAKLVLLEEDNINSFIFTYEDLLMGTQEDYIAAIAVQLLQVAYWLDIDLSSFSIAEEENKTTEEAMYTFIDRISLTNKRTLPERVRVGMEELIKMARMAGIDFDWHLAARIRYELITEEVKEEDE